MRVWRISEPELIFSRGSRDVNPCNGLIKYGPCGPDINKEAEYLPIRVGLIGTVNSTNGIKSFLYNLSNIFTISQILHLVEKRVDIV